MTTEHNSRTITEPEAAALLSHFTCRPQPPRMRWAIRAPASESARIAGALVVTLVSLFWMMELRAFVESGLTPPVQRGAVVGAVGLVVLALVFVRREPEGGR